MRWFRRILDKFLRRDHEYVWIRASCPIGWQPSVLAPVFYGIRDYATADGAPGPCRVFFPSLDGAVFDAPILEGCGRYPLILFAHGNCGETDHYKKWFELPAQLARCGCVVAVPELAATQGGAYPWDDSPDLTRLADTRTWMRLGWVHKSVLLPEPATGLIGHSYGALLAARIPAVSTVAAYASLSAGWLEWPSVIPRPINVDVIPKLLAWGTGDQDVYAALGSGSWSPIAPTKHRLVFDNAQHWDYVPAGRVSCEVTRGPCTLVPTLIGDFAATFFGKYLPPEDWSSLGTRIPNSLIAPALDLTTEQQFFAGGHLMGLSLIGSRAGCRITTAWHTSGGQTGSVTCP